MEVVVPENNSDHENSPTPSVEDLFQRGTYASGTVRVNHKHFPTAGWMRQWWRGGA